LIKAVGPVRVTLVTTDLWVIGDRAYETGKWTYTFAKRGGGDTTLSGRYATVWKQQAAGGWKYYADMGVPN
jgi:ketosteroid isomerase-like protein